MKKKFLLGVLVVTALGTLLGLHLRTQKTYAEDARVVTVYVDGELKTVATNAPTVRAVLERLRVGVGEHDKAEPGLDEAVRGANFSINVYRARPIDVVDGANTYTVVTAERSPQKIAQEAGFKTEPEDEFAFRRSDDSFEGTPGTQMVIRRSKTINLELYGKTTQLNTRATTINELLQERDITLEQGDEVNLPGAARITPGMTVVIASISRQLETVEEDAAFPEELIKDAQQPTTYKSVKTPGKLGKKLVTYETVTKNGGAPTRTAIKEVITIQPVKQVTVVGAKSNTFDGDFGAALGKLRSCEGAYTSNTGNGYYGAYQFNLSTWRSNAPAAYKDTIPSSAPPSVQDEAAANLYRARGWQPWPACSRKLGLQDIYR